MSKKSAWAGAIVAAAGLTVGGIAVAAAADNPDGPPAAFAERHPGGPGKPGRPDKVKLKDSTLVVGRVKSVESGKLTITKDDGSDVSLTTDGSTKLRGGDLNGLKADQRVTVRVKDGKALNVALAKAHEQGTIKDVNGNNATLIQLDGLQTPLDLSAVSEKPKNGDLVAVTGTVSDGKTVKVEQLRQLPK
ncbi:hypothetical protein C8D88_1011802 [Lentzea atacamensis]|jgi:hypothetical protein|uniref:DUF5666 domain-containing protein n=2 Tax=Lentzea TaxID=165301 RepID=A0A316IFK9_9PSEU|nr:hypothetical protein [Lentzea atacamensis]PWK91763.1 hypothetical protein C8D88_1011802 [Lentzea atacamensis]RAS63675.1 hypothetical protein C8D87_10676 [Lentzea atacamensis]